MGINYNPRTVTDGLILHLDAANVKSYPGSGTTWYDLSGNSKNGTLINGPTHSTDNKGNFTFDGVNDVIRVPNNFIPADSSFTISVWVKVITGTSDAKIIDTLKDSVAWDGFCIDISSGYYRFIMLKQYSSPAIHIFMNSSSSIVINAWTNVVVTYNQQSVKIYINGSLDKQQNYSGGFDVGQSNIGIGARNSSANPCNCGISQVSFYNRDLTPQEIQQNFQATRARYGL
jgi:hypothetical protein